MGRTLRSKRLRGVLFRAADGKCQSCGRALQVGWHADHVVPWSRGGETKIENMRALCRMCNLKKGNRMLELRTWQKRAWIACQKAERDFFVEATPGAGKTKFACHVASSKFADDAVDRLVVVVPTLALKEQWADSLHGFGLDAEVDYRGSAWPKDFHGICVTYSQVANDPAMFRYLSNPPNRQMVIFDEIHHCADDASWGLSLEEAFRHAEFRLALSGTPFRSDDASIPFLRYVDGKAAPDYVYGYGEGLRDGVCRHVFFPRQGGTMEWSTPSGRVLKKSFDDEIREDEANQRLRTALTTGSWLTDTLKDANDLLTKMRQQDPDAAGLVIAKDQYHAKGILRKMAAELGVEAVSVLSDDPFAQAKLKSFRDAASPWIVAVRMVSEGIDIPRLRVGVYATNITKEMFFRQAVGRFVRIESDHDDHTASLFIPDDMRLRAFAEEIRKQRVHELDREVEEELKRQRQEGDEDNQDSSMFLPLDSVAENKGTIVQDFTFTEEQLAEAEKLAMGICSREVAAALLYRAGALQGAGPSGSDGGTPKRKTDIRKSLKAQNHKLVGAIAARTGREHWEINIALNRAIRIESVGDAKISDLEKRIIEAKRMLESAEVRNGK